ncbi:MAG: hypothetical protein IT191_05310 [Microbacteriaceae bacterium]|nr:hypothetical protein [Microbacteriaceae bacterium]
MVSNGKLKMTGDQPPALAKKDAAPVPAEKPIRKAPSVFWWIVAILFALVYAWDLFEAIANLLGVSSQIGRWNENQQLNTINTSPVPWAWLWANTALPIVVFFAGLFVCRKRNPAILAIALLAGLGLVAALSLSIASVVGLLVPWSGR